MKCLVTGATGHIGVHLTKLLVDEGHEVCAVIRNGSRVERLNDVCHRVHFKYFSDMFDDMWATPDVVFHCAWDGVTNNTRNDQEQICNVIEAQEIFGAVNCGCFVGIGSQAEYGPCNLPVSENSATNPATMYGIAKLTTGLMLKTLCEREGIEYLWFRLQASFGPYDDPTRLIPTLIINALHNKPSNIIGNRMLDYLYVEDVAEAIYDTTMSNERGIFNLGRGVSHSIYDIADYIYTRAGASCQPYESKTGIPKESCLVDISKLRTKTAWWPIHSLAEGLGKTINWYKGQGI